MPYFPAIPRRLLALAFLAGAFPAFCRAQAPPSQADLERRVQELENTIRIMQAQQRAPATPGGATLSLDQASPPEDREAGGTDQPGPGRNDRQAGTGGGSGGPSGGGSDGKSGSGGDSGSKSGSSSKPLVAGWDDGFFLSSEKKDFLLRITGQIQADYRAFLTDADQTDVDTFLVRRARLGIEANMFQYYEFRLLPDFGQGQARVQDAFMNVHYVDYLQFEVGKFKQPFSYEQLVQDRFVPTMERSMIDQLVPARDVGVMIHGQKLFDDFLDYGAAVSNGQINGDADNNEHKDVNARVAVRPFYDPCEWPVLHYLQPGVSIGVGVEQELVNPNTLRTPATVPWLVFDPTVRANGVRWRLSPELTYFLGGFGFATQYFHQEQKLQPSATGAGSRFLFEMVSDGYYVMATYLLTGETRTTYSQPITPIRPFNPCYPFSCPGAWELVARVSRLKEDGPLFLPGAANLADPTRYSSGATEMTLGYNWYWNNWVRMQFNWEHAWFDDPVRLGFGPGGLTKHSDTVYTRFQIIF